jgi:hypothetical protein
MAKQSDPLAGAFETEKAGLLSGLFAEENELDRRALWRIGSWGVAAVGAVIVAVMSNQWSLGLRREQVAAADLARHAQQIQSLAKESQTETRRLASAIETLNGDRDRLFSRVTVIEQGLDSVTGALAKQTTTAQGTGPQASSAPPASSSGQPQAAAPVPAPVTTTAAVSPAPDKPRAPEATTASTPAAAQAAANGQAPPATAALQPAPISPAAAASLVARSMMGPPDPAATKLIEAPKMAEMKPADVSKPAEVKAVDGKTADAKMAEAKGADPKPADPKLIEAKAADVSPAAAPATPAQDVFASASAEETEADVPGIPVKRTDFAVDLGSANTLGGLRALWRSVRHVNADLGALSPIILIKEGTGLGMQLHLAAGPLKDAAAAAKICAVLAESKRPCETAVYDGQKLAMKEGETQSLPSIKPASPAEAKPSGSKHGARHAAKKEEPPPAPPKPPEPATTSTFSALFGHKSQDK